MADKSSSTTTGPLTGEDESTRGEVQGIRTRVHRKLLETLDLAQARRMPPEELRRECSRRADALLAEEQWPLSAPEKKQLVREVMDLVFGLGPLEEFFRDDTISDILVNGPKQIYIERRGLLSSTDATFRDDQHLLQSIQRIAAGVGRRIDESSPMLDARLADGSRVNAIIPPLALDGPMLSIRRFGSIPIDEEQLHALGTWTREMSMFLRSCVRCKMNILISGGTGTGKTTLLNAMSKWIPSDERVVTIEDAAELQLQRDHVVRLETRPPNIEGKGEVTQRELLRNTLRMRPDRIIIGEVRGPEALDMLQAMNTGHEGSMTTVHANNPRDALGRLENMVSMTGFNLSINVIREQMASALNVLVHLGRMRGGRRKLVTVSEITGMEQDVICLQDLFKFTQTGVTEEGHAEGYFEVCGVRPMLLHRIEAMGETLPPRMFQSRKLHVGGTEGGASAGG